MKNLLHTILVLCLSILFVSCAKIEATDYNNKFKNIKITSNKSNTIRDGKEYSTSNEVVSTANNEEDTTSKEEDTTSNEEVDITEPQEPITMPRECEGGFETC
tara:strand:- start:95 stop:403 length:309 start_codon:yes stop_codon:yes gene_type:complete